MGKPAKSYRKLEGLLLSHPDQWRVEPSKKINKKHGGKDFAQYMYTVEF
jgi:hypothetical protein